MFYIRWFNKIIRMKKASLLFTLAFLLVATSFKPASEIKWLGFNEGYALAKKTKKIMLVDVYTDWCGWCKRMDRDAYGKSEIIDMVSKDFVPIKFNPEIEGVTYTFNGKTYSGGELAGAISDYKLSGYPTTIFIQPKNNKKNIVVGYKDAAMMKDVLTSIKSELALGK